jgi:hypothetical protein
MRSGGVMQGFDAATWAVIGLQVRRAGAGIGWGWMDWAGAGWLAGLLASLHAAALMFVGKQHVDTQTIGPHFPPPPCVPGVWGASHRLCRPLLP